MIAFTVHSEFTTRRQRVRAVRSVFDLAASQFSSVGGQPHLFRAIESRSNDIGVGSGAGRCCPNAPTQRPGPRDTWIANPGVMPGSLLVKTTAPRRAAFPGL